VTAPNLNAPTSIIGTTTVAHLTTAAISVLSNSAGSNALVKANVVMIANQTASAIAVTASYVKGTNPYAIATSVSIPAFSTLDLLNKQLYLVEGDSITLTAATAGVLDAVASGEVIS